MASAREAAVLALVAALEATNALVTRATDIPSEIPPEGIVQVSEGVDAIEAILSPLAYAHDLAINVAAAVTAVDEPTRDAELDTLLMLLSDAITSDRTLGNAVEFADVGPPEFEVWEGDGPAKAAQFVVTLSFTTVASPLA